MKRPVIVSSWCFVILIWRRVMSVGCFALNGYEMHRDTNTYNCRRRLRSSSALSWLSCGTVKEESIGGIGSCNLCGHHEQPVAEQGAV